MKNIKAQVAIGIVCLVSGFFVTLQLRTMDDNKVSAYPSQIRLEQTQELLRMEKDKTETLYQQVMEYKDEIEEYQQRAAANDGAVDMLMSDLSKNKLLAGTVSVEGPGVVVTMEDGTAIAGAMEDENIYVVHDDDVLRVLNELRAAGAEAISINDQRVVASSEIRCAGNTISINNTRTAAPFVIKAIGDSEQLKSGLTMRGGVVDELSRWINLKVETKSAITLPAYTGNTNFKYAVPVSNAEAGGKTNQKKE